MPSYVFVLTRMYLQMGYKKGMGLGKNLHGRAEPIQVVKRSGKGAVGHYGNEDPNRNKPATGEFWMWM